jgi:hypothetical protein
VQRSLNTGWNTWDVYSVAEQVLAPEGLAIRVGLRNRSALDRDAFLPDALIGRFGKDDEKVVPGIHTWNGSYTQCEITWRGHAVTLETAHDGDDVVMLASPAQADGEGPLLVVSAGILWNRPGSVAWQGDHIAYEGPSGARAVYWTGGGRTPPTAVPLSGPYFAAPLGGPIGICSGKPRSLAEIRAALGRARPAGTGMAGAIQSVIGWDTTYEPAGDRVFSPVSRLWSIRWGGFVFFDWDTFFAASLCAVGDRDLAYANAIEILNEETPGGFVPNYARAGGWKSFDRSEPPVGSITVLGLYRKYHDLWLLRDTFAPLLRWNRWWDQHRTYDGYLVHGTDRGTNPHDPDDGSVGTKQGAVFESGMDNSPIYDQAPFDEASGRLHYADVGLMGLYAADCGALAEIASRLGRNSEEAELRARAARIRGRLQTLWSDKAGIFLNRDLDTGAPSLRLSPANFYPLLARAATPAQARRMVREHLMNPAEFWGEWVVPSIERSDPAFRDQNYWRGRIWGPINYLVYLGLRNYDEPEARRLLAEKSAALFNREWSRNGHVHENYNAMTGEGDDVTSSDRYYHWGALLGLIQLDEAGAGP